MAIRIIKEKYVQCAEEQQKCFFSGDVKQGNKCADKLIRYNAIIEKTDDESVNKVIDYIIDSDKPNAVMWISFVCAKRKYRLTDIKEKLVRYSVDRDLGLLAFNAKVILEQIEKKWGAE